MVQIKNVADKTISWTNSPTEVDSFVHLVLDLMPRVSYMLNLHCPFVRHFSLMVIPLTGCGVSVHVAAKEKFALTNTTNSRRLIIFFMYALVRYKLFTGITIYYCFAKSIAYHFG
jgi:hypothetical protein